MTRLRYSYHPIRVFKAPITLLCWFTRRRPDHIPLYFARHIPVSLHNGAEVLVSNVVAPGFELLQRFAMLFCQRRQQVAENVRMAIAQSGILECGLESVAYRACCRLAENGLPAT